MRAPLPPREAGATVAFMLIPAIGYFWAFGIGIFGVVILGLWIFGLIDVMRRPDVDRQTRLGWVLLIVLLPIAGTLIYLAKRPLAPEEREKIVGAEVRRHS
jgi:Phospholipase_D-nuclease N-terminal